VRHRIHVPGPIAAGTEVVVTGEEFHHAVRVARVRESEEVELFDGKGGLGSGRVLALAKDQATIAVNRLLPSRESPLSIHLAAAIIQLEKFELVLQKATELGVRSIIPLVADRVEIRPERYRGKAERWEKIIFEAVKQSGRAVLPLIEPPAAFADIAGRAGVKLVFDADETPDEAPSAMTEVTIFIGPEGAWSEDEIRIGREQKCLFQRLGPRRLRAETAAIAATAVVAARHGDI
jgi:16S rRNA (uracil1498-N3)-methyltransferase